MTKQWKIFLTAIMYFTRIRVPQHIGHEPGYLNKAAKYFPLIGWITPVICIFVESYYYGFSMLDYSCQRHNLTSPASIAYISQHKGLAIGNGLVFYGMHFVPILGWVLAPAYAVIAATISLYHQNLE